MAEYETFRFDGYDFEIGSGELSMRYSYAGGPAFEETAILPAAAEPVNEKALAHVLDYLYVAAGTSYYKAYVPPKIDTGGLLVDEQDARLYDELYQRGLSQHLYENGIDPESLASFKPSDEKPQPAPTDAEGILLLMSGGKDSLVSAALLDEHGHEYSMMHMSSTGEYPRLIDKLSKPTYRVARHVDVEGLRAAEDSYNGHVPFSAILAGYGLAAAVLTGNNVVLAANESSADEANVEVDGYSVNHQYSKTWRYEKLLQDYLERRVPGLHYASHLRRFNELQIAETFVDRCWQAFGDSFSSCNRANYKQGTETGRLSWCGSCPKCANAWLLFAPFMERPELEDLFSGKNLSKDESLRETFRQLMGLSDIKPFECVGTFDELRVAYRRAVEKDEGYRIEGIMPDEAAAVKTDTMNEQKIVKELHES